MIYLTLKMIFLGEINFYPYFKSNLCQQKKDEFLCRKGRCKKKKKITQKDKVKYQKQKDDFLS